VEPAVRPALVGTHHADRAETGLGVAPDGLFVGCRRVDREPVVAASPEQEAGQQRHGLGARAPALEPATQVDVDPGMPVLRVVLLVVLDAAGHLAVDLHHQEHGGPVRAQAGVQRLDRSRVSPPAGHRRLGQDRAQLPGVAGAARPQRDRAAGQHRAARRRGSPAHRLPRQLSCFLTCS
jgi:hypothetical protein